MTKQQRILFFGIGVVLGLVMVQHLLQSRAEKKRASDRFAEKRIVPGMLVDWAQEGRAVYGEGVMEAKIGPGGDGFAQTRRVLTGGRARRDDLGFDLPPEFLAITEYYAESGPLTEKTRVSRYEFAFADRVLVSVREAADSAKVYAALKPLGVRLMPEPGSRTALTARFPKPTLATVDEALAALKALPEVVSAAPVKLDWTKDIAKNP